MTGGASSSSSFCSFVMRSHHCWTLLSILVPLLLTSNADSEECEDQILVHRNTVYTASAGKELIVKCRVAFCHSTPPKITWKRYEGKLVPVNMSSNIKTEWEPLGAFEGNSYLIFQNILKSDSGVYRCGTEESVSHMINVSVNDGVFNDTLENNVTATPTINSDKETENIWIYVYSAAGILSFIIIVILISVVSLRGCKGKSGKETGTENQYISIPMMEHPSLHTPPRGSPSVPLPRRPSHRGETQSRLSRGSEQGGGQLEVDAGRQRTTAEEEEGGGGSIVYAALNHQPRPAATRPRRVVEENSEYAAIRVA